MNDLYKVIGISKQAVYNYERRQLVLEDKLQDLIIETEQLKAEHPGCGVEKMYYTLSPDFIGRDRFVEIFMQLGFGVKRKRNYRRTTYAVNKYYPNLIKGMKVNAPNIIWQSDITYIKIGDKFYYAVFIIDVYTKEIVGYSLSDHMRATANMEALNMATNKFGYPQIHHSDRGSQYVYKEYIALLKENNTKISMALSAQDNAYAERINRTIKEEYLEPKNIKSYKGLKRELKNAVEHYNTRRIHNHLNRETPGSFRRKTINLLPQDRPMVIIYTEGNNKVMRISNPHNFTQDLSLAHNCPKIKQDTEMKKKINIKTVNLI